MAWVEFNKGSIANLSQLFVRVKVGLISWWRIFSTSRSYLNSRNSKISNDCVVPWWLPLRIHSWFSLSFPLRIYSMFAPRGDGGTVRLRRRESGACVNGTHWGRGLRCLLYWSHRRPRNINITESGSSQPLVDTSLRKLAQNTLRNPKLSHLNWIGATSSNTGKMRMGYTIVVQGKISSPYSG